MQSLLNWKKLGFVLFAATAAVAEGASLSPSGSEYRILPTLPGDQTLTQLALGADGGFLVTQDNSVDGNGLGIRARKFYADLSGAQNSFQVNAQNLGDQQNPRVALLKGGGAVFAWESSAANGHRVKVRFLDNQDVLSPYDIDASRLAAGSQGDPALAVLADGTVVVVWAEWDRDGSMDGIFGQLFTAAGARVGDTFQVNEKTDLSQRSPAVAALGNGGFVVGWVTDENRFQTGFTSSESIDIYLRIFGANGAAVSGEFPANTWRTEVKQVVENDGLTDKTFEVREVCANPVVAATATGFRAAWSQRRLEKSIESWDVVTRAFNVNGTAASDAVVVNNVTKGDQFSPRIANAGGTQLIAWTSFGQDGADEGIYARLINSDGAFAGNEFLVNSRTISKQIYPAVSGAGDNRYVAAWSSFVGGTASYDLFAQQYTLGGASEVASPVEPFVSSLSQNSICVTWADIGSVPGISYLVYVDDEAGPTQTTQAMLTVTRANWQPSSTHTVRLAYKTAAGQISPLSVAVSVTTWGVDANGDGLPDDWQQINFGKLRPSGKDDTDGDGATNYEEFLAGTDPTDPASVLEARISPREQGLYLEWNTVPGNYYQIQVTSDFASWSNIGTPRFAHSTIDALPCTGPGQVRYYRVIRMR